MATVGDLGNSDMVLRTSITDGIAGPIAGANKLWLSIWSGETMHAYDQYNTFESLVDSKTIANGVAMEFPLTGTIALKTAWNAGEELVGGTSKSSTVAVKLDKRPIAAHFEIDNVDLMQTQWEFRSELARQAGMTLANARDRQISAYIARAAMEDINWTGTDSGGSYTDPFGATPNDPRQIPTGPVFISTTFKNLGAIYNSAAGADDRTNAALEALRACEDFLVYLQVINAPTDGVFLAVTPRAFQDIRALGVARSTTTVVNSQPLFGGVAEAGGLGAALTQGFNNLNDSLEYMGVKIIKSNHLPVSNYAAAGAGIGEARYNLNFSSAGIAGLIFQRSCVASLKLQGLKVDTVDDIRRNTTFTVASMMAGTGVLRPECAAVLVGPVATNTDSDSGWLQSGGFLFPNGAASVFAEVDGANVGGSEAAVARAQLRIRTGMTREFVATASGAFPYA